MKTTQTFLLTTIAAGLMATIASAGTDTHIYNFGPTSITGFSSTAVSTLSKFDDNLLAPGESLLSITFTLSLTNVVAASATNGGLTCDALGCTPGPSLNVLTLGASVPGLVTGPSSLSLGTTTTTIQDYGAGIPVLNIFTSCAGFSCTVSNLNILNVTNLSNTSSNAQGIVDLPGNFDPYHAVGGGYISGLSLGLGARTNASTGDAGLNFFDSSMVNGFLKVDYGYGVASSEAPEPATAGLMGVSLLGACVLGLRKRRARR